MRVPSITVLAAALMVSTAALGAPRETPSASQAEPVHEARAAFIMKRAVEIMPLKRFKIKLLSNGNDARSVYVLSFDARHVPGAPRVLSSGIMVYPGISTAEINQSLDRIAGELQQILDNVAAGRPWNSGVPQMREISSSF